ncbi:hypothetical protein DL767_004135 [Monosporascus sp. MG133]|nr:hypothetical protein DL767_004135 [Monosporascus sp. MG133]
MAPPKIRLATASPGTQATTKETLAQLHQIAKRAAAIRADILLLPEAYIGGYPRGADFGCKVGARTAEGREEYLQYFKSAVDLGDTVGDGAGAGDAWLKRRLPGQLKCTDGAPEGDEGVRGDGTREELERIARETGVFIVVGLIEKVGGSLYCAVGYVCPKLGFVGKRRKVQPGAWDNFMALSRPADKNHEDKRLGKETAQWLPWDAKIGAFESGKCEGIKERDIEVLLNAPASYDEDMTGFVLKGNVGDEPYEDYALTSPKDIRRLVQITQ